MNKKIFFLILVLFSIAVLSKACIRADIVESDYLFEKGSSSQQETVFNIEQPKNVTINGVDYLQSQTPIGNFGGKFVSSTIGEGPKTFNPWNSKDATSSSLSDIMFDALVTTNAFTGKVEPRLAKSFSISENGKEYIFNLRRGLVWSDGKPITADDVYFTYDTIVFKGYGNTSTRDSLLIDGEPPKIQKVDDYTVKFITKEPFAPFLRLLSVPIAPKHVFAPVCDKGKKYFDSFWGPSTKPSDFVTSGAFKLVEYVPAQRVIYKRNPSYYVINTKNQKLPYLDEYIVLIVGDLNNELLKFKAAEIDILNLRGVNVSSFKKLEEKSDYKIYNLGPTSSTMFLTFNLNTRKDDNGRYYVDKKKQAWFNDKNFRSAIDYAVDRKNMVLNITNGVAKPLFTAEALPSIFLNEKLANGHEQDFDLAREYLKESGFYWDKKGQLFDKLGNKVEFDLYTNAGNTEREAIGVMIKQDLADLGIKVNFKPIEFNSLVNKLTNSLDWETCIMGLTGSTLEPHSGKNVWNSNGPLHLFNKRLKNEAEVLPWENELNEIYEKGALELNFEKRKKMYDRYQEIIYEEKPIIYLYSPLQMIAIRKKFGNIYPTPLGGMTHNLEEIYIKK